MFKFDPDARAYFAASNALMEEIEERGIASAQANESLTAQVWAALDDEWKTRQVLLDSGATGNYEQAMANRKVLAITVLTVSCLTTLLLQKRRVEKARRHRSFV